MRWFETIVKIRTATGEIRDDLVSKIMNKFGSLAVHLGDLDKRLDEMITGYGKSSIAYGFTNHWSYYSCQTGKGSYEIQLPRGRKIVVPGGKQANMNLKDCPPASARYWRPLPSTHPKEASRASGSLSSSATSAARATRSSRGFGLPIS